MRRKVFLDCLRPPKGCFLNHHLRPQSPMFLNNLKIVNLHPSPPPHVVPSRRVHLKLRLLGERRHVSGWSHVVSKRLFPESPPPSPVADVPQHFENSQLTPPPLPPHVVPSRRVHLKRRLLGERRHVSGRSHVVSKRLFPQSPPLSPVANVPQHFENSQLTSPPPPPHVSGGSHDYEVSKRSISHANRVSRGGTEESLPLCRVGYCLSRVRWFTFVIESVVREELCGRLQGRGNGELRVNESAMSFNFHQLEALKNMSNGFDSSKIVGKGNQRIAQKTNPEPVTTDGFARFCEHNGQIVLSGGSGIPSLATCLIDSVIKCNHDLWHKFALKIIIYLPALISAGCYWVLFCRVACFRNSCLSSYRARTGISGLSEASKRVFSQSPFPSPVLNAPQHFESGQFTPPSPPHVVPSCRVHFKRRRSLLQLSLPEVAVSNCRVHFKGCNFLASSGSVNSGRRRFLGERRNVSEWSHVVSKRLFPESPPPSPVANARVHFKRRRSLLQLSLLEVAVSNCRVHFKGCNFLALKQRPPASNRCVHTKLRRFLGEPSPPQMVSNDRVQFKHRQITFTV
ncbi:hypothetical protein Pint_31561 [Pistacia integerrima]|uniref:Uncharacterized protein n=1 Tax=Pistacia integerrima TaxID=434235 RepID=A0ACC0XT58_9ROSI|nr:hypothetical protein Pint_31561 [Pistacia integerrima]